MEWYHSDRQMVYNIGVYQLSPVLPVHEVTSEMTHAVCVNSSKNEWGVGAIASRHPPTALPLSHSLDRATLHCVLMIAMCAE